MGSEPSNFDSNFSKSDSESISNSGNKLNKIETMDCLMENENTIIKRVWIAKKSVTISDEHIDLNLPSLIRLPEFFRTKIISKKKYKLLYKNLFNIESCFNWNFKHWAIILELSNNSYVNIQFGKNGFSLKEFNKTETEGYSALNSIIETWGEKNAPISFCYLGYANFEYEKFKNYLKAKKDKEIIKYEENKYTYYNVCFKNCQHFCCEIEKYIFGSIKIWHSFDYYIIQFFEHFFPKINIQKLQLKYENELKKKNEDIFRYNFTNFPEDKVGINTKKEIILSLFYTLFENVYSRDIGINHYGYISLPKKVKDEIKKIYALNLDDYIYNLKIQNY